MNYQDLIDYNLSKQGAVEDYPFGEEVIVMKIANKMFSLISRKDGVAYINLKCDPELALALRHEYEAVNEGYHMNKKHWNTVLIDGSIPDKKKKKMIDHSYDLVFSKLKKSEQEYFIHNYNMEKN